MGKLLGIDLSPKEDPQVANQHMKTYSNDQSLEKHKSKPYYQHTLGWLKQSKTQHSKTILSIDKDMEKLEPSSHVAGRNIIWCSHFGKQFLRDFPGDPVAKPPCSQGQGAWSESQIPHAATKSSHAATKDPVCHN